jgi:hypothetical protein
MPSWRYVTGWVQGEVLPASSRAARESRERTFAGSSGAVTTKLLPESL